MPSIKKPARPAENETIVNVTVTFTVDVPASTFVNEVDMKRARNAEEAMAAIQAGGDPEYDEDNTTLYNLYNYIDLNPDTCEWSIDIDDAEETPSEDVGEDE